MFLASFTLLSCHDETEQEKMENREERKVGHVYNRDIQGVQIENHDNQFYISRMKSNDTTAGKYEKATIQMPTGTAAENSANATDSTATKNM